MLVPLVAPTQSAQKAIIQHGNEQSPSLDLQGQNCH